MARRRPLAALQRFLGERVPADSLVRFRIGFGLLGTVAAARYVAYGWVDQFLVQPSVHFTWIPGLPVPSAPVLYGLFGVQALSGLLVAAGRWPRAALAAWLLSFGYVELLEKALYLNHYVLFTVLGLVLLTGPLHRLPRWPTPGATVPRGWLTLLRVQAGLVYFWAGFCKLNPDWLFRAEPLRTWLAAKAELPVLGPLLALPQTAWFMSWGGAAYDLLIPFLLLHPRTRALAVALVLFFHVVVGTVFPIGIFPLLMVLAASLFLDPAWPRPAQAPTPGIPRSRPATLLWVAVVLVSALFPARFVLYDGMDVSWTERGHRFAWRVLLNEKTGLVDYRIVDRASGRVWRAHPAEQLTRLQHEQMRTQPDMIRDYALHLAGQHAAEGRDVAVYADAWASLNGRPSQRLIDPTVDLTQPLSLLNQQGWIVPLER